MHESQELNLHGCCSSESRPTDAGRYRAAISAQRSRKGSVTFPTFSRDDFRNLERARFRSAPKSGCPSPGTRDIVTSGGRQRSTFHKCLFKVLCVCGRLSGCLFASVNSKPRVTFAERPAKRHGRYCTPTCSVNSHSTACPMPCSLYQLAGFQFCGRPGKLCPSVAKSSSNPELGIFPVVCTARRSCCAATCARSKSGTRLIRECWALKSEGICLKRPAGTTRRGNFAAA